MLVSLVGLLVALVSGSNAENLPPRTFSLANRAANNDGSIPTYKNSHAAIEDRINDLLPRMTVEEKVSQL